MTLAPIVLFVYNRPAHTRRTVEALLKNEEAKESDLIVYSDAPKKPETADAVREVRDYIRTISGFRSIRIVERDRNWGLANSIIDGVTTVVNEYGRIIVLEDDLVVTPHFLEYMNRALECYKNDEKVMHVSGYMFPVDSSGLLETFFLRTASCWGWATWDRAWRYFEKDTQSLLNEFKEQTIYRFNLDGTYDFWSQVEKNAKGKIDTWGVFWYASIFRKGGLCLHPKFSMVNNIGHDDSGVHCAGTDRFTVELVNSHITYFVNNLVEDKLALERTRAFFSPPPPSFTSRVLHALRNRLFHNQ